MTFPISRLLYTTIQSRGSSSGYVPGLFWVFFAGLNVVHHHCWFWIETKRVWKPENAGLLIIGAGVAIGARDNDMIKVIAKVIDIALHTSKAIGAFKRLERNCNLLWRLLEGKEKIYVRVDWEKTMNCTYFSPSTAYSLEKNKLKYIERCKRLSNCTLNIFRDLFLLSMHVIDAKMAYHTDTFQILNGGVNLKDLANELQGDYTIVEDFLAAFHVPQGAEKFVNKTLARAENVSQAPLNKPIREIVNCSVSVLLELSASIATLFGRISERKHGKIQKYDPLIIKINMSDLSVIDEE